MKTQTKEVNTTPQDKPDSFTTHSGNSPTLKLDYPLMEYIPPMAFREILKINKPVIHIDKKQTGNGGTTAFLNYIIQHNLKGALILPNQATALLKASMWSKRHDVNISLIYGGTPLECPHRDTEASLTVYVANSFNAEEVSPKYDVILVDEYHKLIIDSDFREVFCYLDIKLNHWSQQARVLTISATPLAPCDVVIDTKQRPALPPITLHQIVKLPLTVLDDINNGENVLIYINRSDWMRSLINQIPPEHHQDISILTGHTIRRKSMDYYLPDNNLFLKKHDPNKRIQIVSSAGIEGWDYEKNDVKIYMLFAQNNNAQALTVACLRQLIGRVRGSIKSIDISTKGEYGKAQASKTVKDMMEAKTDLSDQDLIFAGDELTRLLSQNVNSMNIFQNDFRALNIHHEGQTYRTRSSNRFKKQQGQLVYSTVNKYKRFIHLSQFHLNDFEVAVMDDLNTKDYMTNKMTKPQGESKAHTFRAYSHPLDLDYHWHLENTMEHYNPLESINELFKTPDLYESKLVDGKVVFLPKYQTLLDDIQSNITTKIDFLKLLPSTDDRDKVLTTLRDKKACVGAIAPVMSNLIQDKTKVIKTRLSNISTKIANIKKQMKSSKISKTKKKNLSLEIVRLKEDREKLKDNYPLMILKGLLYMLDLNKGKVTQSGYRYYNAITILGGDICGRIKDEVNQAMDARYLVSSDLNQIAYKIMLAFTRTKFNPFSDVYDMGQCNRDVVKVMVSKIPNSIKDYDEDTPEKRKVRKMNILDSMEDLGIQRKNAENFYKFILGNNGDKNNYWHYLYTAFEFQMLACLELVIGKKGARLHDEIYFLGSFDIPDIKFNIYVGDTLLCSYSNWFTGNKSNHEYDLILNEKTGKVIRRLSPPLEMFG